MPRPGYCWRHVVLATHRSWLPGDPRGFRSKCHKIHSSGDYKNPPPPGEHAGLHQYWRDRAAGAVLIPEPLREPMGRAILAELAQREITVLPLAIGEIHAHFLAELPIELPETKKICGRCKTAACYAVRESLPGTVWGGQGSYKRIKDKEHQRNTYYYILRHEDAWVWSFRNEIPPPFGGGLGS